METAIRWSPNSTLSSQHFLFADVANRSFNLGTITSYRPGADGLKHNFSPTYRYVPSFRALDWAPFNGSLVAVGTPSGETRVLSIDDAGPALSFPAKYQRPCNAVAFSGKGLLATGLERVRNDFCLNVWDVNAQIPGKAADTPTPGGRGGYVEPVRKFASSEAVSSIKFFASQPDVLVVGVKGVGIRCYDTREGTGNASLQFQTHCVHNTAIDPLNEVHFACAGPLKDTTIQIWDVRFGLPYTSSFLGSSKSSSVGSGSEGGSNQGPVIVYEDVFNAGSKDDIKRTAANIWSLRYCKGKKGCLGSLASNGDFRAFETQTAYMEPESQSDEHGDLTLGENRKDLVKPVFTRRVHRMEMAFNDSRRPRVEKERIVSFDFTNLAGSKGQPTALILRGDQSIEILEIGGPQPVSSVSAFGDLAISKNVGQDTETAASGAEEVPITFLRDSVNFTSPSDESAGFEVKKQNWRKILQKSSRIESDGSIDYGDGVDVSSFERHKRLFGVSSEPQKLSAKEALSISTIARERCSIGYGLDCKRNIEVVNDNPWLQKMWAWIERAKTHATEGALKKGPLDLSYLGVYRLWNQDLGSENDSRKMINARSNLASIIKQMVQDLELPNSITGRTSYPEHRQLCLYTIGLGLKEQQLADEVIQLARGGGQTKAAALAIMLGHHRLASMALKTGKLESHHRALAIAVAAYVKGNTDDSWSDVVQAVLQDVTDPYARAIFALVKRGNWHDVLKEVSLPLRERVGIALLHLSDAEWTRYLNDATAGAIKEGDVEGIILTGLTEQAVTLFETYIRRFSDLQTATLALSHSSPRFFMNPLVEAWRDTYRSWMNAWRMYTQRARYDVGLTKLSTLPSGTPSIKPSARQCTLRCNFCEDTLDRSLSEESTSNREDSTTSSFGSHKGSVFGDSKFGTTCPKCGRHMPRCVVCDHWLGVPDQETKYGAKEAASKTREEIFGNMVAFCQQCLHMTHVAHAKMWFSKHPTCPKIDCDCQCWEGMGEN